MEANIQTGGQTDNQFTSEKILTQTDRQTKNLTVSDITSLQNENIPGNTNACIPHNQYTSLTLIPTDTMFEYV